MDERANGVSERVGWGGVWLRWLAWRNERARRGRVRSAATIRANAVSEDMSLSVRERAEGFLPLSSTEPTSLPSERAEGFLAVAIAVTTPFPSE